MNTILKNQILSRAADLEKLREKLLQRLERPELYSFLKGTPGCSYSDIARGTWCAFKSR
jgi:hypothetical protein